MRWRTWHGHSHVSVTRIRTQYCVRVMCVRWVVSHLSATGLSHYTYVRVKIHIYMYIYIHIYTNTHIYVYTYIHKYIYLSYIHVHETQFNYIVVIELTQFNYLSYMYLSYIHVYETQFNYTVQLHSSITQFNYIVWLPRVNKEREYIYIRQPSLSRTALQHIAARKSGWAKRWSQCVAVCCRVHSDSHKWSLCVAVWCRAVAVRCSSLHHTATHCDHPTHVGGCCVLQCPVGRW